MSIIISALIQHSPLAHHDMTHDYSVLTRLGEILKNVDYDIISISIKHCHMTYISKLKTSQQYI